MDNLRSLLPEGMTITAIAEELGVNKGNVSRWFSLGVPPKRVKAVSRITGIPAETLNPEVFGDEASQ